MNILFRIRSTYEGKKLAILRLVLLLLRTKKSVKSHGNIFLLSSSGFIMSNNTFLLLLNSKNHPNQSISPLFSGYPLSIFFYLNILIIGLFPNEIIILNRLLGHIKAQKKRSRECMLYPMESNVLSNTKSISNFLKILKPCISYGYARLCFCLNFKSDRGRIQSPSHNPQFY